jgi:hypothetical protein
MTHVAMLIQSAISIQRLNMCKCGNFLIDSMECDIQLNQIQFYMQRSVRATNIITFKINLAIAVMFFIIVDVKRHFVLFWEC